MRCLYCDRDHAGNDSLYSNSLVGLGLSFRVLFRPEISQYVCDDCWVSSKDGDKLYYEDNIDNLLLSEDFDVIQDIEDIIPIPNLEQET